MAVKNLFILYSCKSKINELEVDTNEINDLVSFVEIKSIDLKFRDKFNKIFDLSKETDKDIIKILFKEILDFSNIERWNREVNYDYIYIYENDTMKKCKVHTTRKVVKDDFFENNFYNHGNVLKDYCGYRKKSSLSIEHAMFWGNKVPDSELNDLHHAILTFGDYRYECIRKVTNKEVIKIGPYINYTENLYPDVFMNTIKNKLGKTMLVFPAHSTWGIDTDYNIIKFIEYIKEFAKRNDFKSVLICMYSRDVERELNKLYENEGFIVATCGNRYDLNFMSKLKTIINLSDHVLSNTLGTYIGYSVFLNKTLTLYKQDIKESGELIGKIQKDEQWLKYNKILDSQKEEFFEVFKEYESSISESQYNLCSLYWGFDYIKTKEEMSEIFKTYK